MAQKVEPSPSASSPLRGTFFIPLAKIYFVLAGYLIYFALARILGPENFGVYGVVVGIVSVLNMLFISGTVQGVSKFVSEDPGRSEAVKRTAFKMQFCLGGITSIGFYLLAPVIAGILHDPLLVPYLRIASFIIVFYALYAVFIGVLNGQKRFVEQAFFDIGYSTMRMGFIVGGAFWGWGVSGAVGGFAAAALVIFLIVFFKYGFVWSGEEFPLTKILRFSFVVMGIAVLMNLLQQMDLLLLKALASKDQANLLSGFYTASQTIARVPYMIIVSLAYIIFPLVSQSSYQKDDSQTKRLIQQGIRACLLLTVPVVVIFSASASETVNLLYSSRYQPAGEALTILSFGYLALTLLMITTTIISSLGRPAAALFIIAGTCLIQFLAGLLLIPMDPMRGPALCTLISGALGVLMAGAWIYARYKGFVSVLCLFRVAGASLVIYLISYLFAPQGILLVLFNIALLMVYLLLLLLSREVKIQEILGLKAAFSLKKQAAV